MFIYVHIYTCVDTWLYEMGLELTFQKCNQLLAEEGIIAVEGNQLEYIDSISRFEIDLDSYLQLVEILKSRVDPRFPISNIYRAQYWEFFIRDHELSTLRRSFIEFDSAAALLNTIWGGCD